MLVLIGSNILVGNNLGNSSLVGNNSLLGNNNFLNNNLLNKISLDLLNLGSGGHATLLGGSILLKGRTRHNGYIEIHHL